MGRIGIGQKIKGKRPGFQLQRISAGGKKVYDGTEKKMIKVPARELILEMTSEEATEITLKLLTPLRLKFENQLQAKLPFHLLIRAALRRIALLNRHFGEGEPDLDYKGLVAKASNIKIKQSNLHWFDWKRYSNRQEQSMLMGGMVGEITYQGELQEFIPLIHYAEEVHLGKATTFGLGQIQVII